MTSSLQEPARKNALRGKLTVGIVGAGVMGQRHIEAIRSSPYWHLAGLAEPSKDGRECARSLGVPWYPAAEALLDEVRPDAAVIASPNDTHRQMAFACIERGIPAIVEKPIAASLADAAAIVSASERRGVPILVGHHRRYNPIIRSARAAIAGGVLGRLTTASVLYTFCKPPEYFDVAWRRSCGGGPVLINLIHEIDLIRHLGGEIESVQAFTSNATRGFEVEDAAAVLLRLSNGALVTLSLSDNAAAPWSWDLAAGESRVFPPQPARVQTHFFCGTEGSLALPTLEHWSYHTDRSWYLPISREVLAVESGDPYREQLHHLWRVIRHSEAPLVSAADGMSTLAVTLAIHEAAKTGHLVNIDRHYRSQLDDPQCPH